MQMTVNHKSFELRRYTNMAAVVFPGKFWTLWHQVKKFYTLTKQTSDTIWRHSTTRAFFSFFGIKTPKLCRQDTALSPLRRTSCHALMLTQRTLYFCEKFCLKWDGQSYGTKLKAQYFQIRLSKDIDNSIFINLPFFSVFSLESVYHFFL